MRALLATTIVATAIFVAACEPTDEAWPTEPTDLNPPADEREDETAGDADDDGASPDLDEWPTCSLVARSGEGYLEMCNGVRVLHVSGSPYEMGYQMGELLREPVTEIIHLVRNYIDPWGAVWRLLQNVPVNLEPNIRPEFAEEMRGLVDGLNNDVTYEEIVAGNCLGDIFGAIRAFMDNYLDVEFCSLTASWGDATADGELIATRNFDYMNLFHRFNYVAVVNPDSGHAFVHTGITGLIGTHVGMSDIGLTGALAYNSSYDSDMSGVPMLLLLREAIQYSDSVDEALDVIRANDRTMGLNYMFTDGFTKEAEVIEVSGGKSALRTGDMGDYVIATNHYVAPEMIAEQKGYEPEHTTQCRYHRLNQLFEEHYGKIDLALAGQIVRDHWDPSINAVRPWRTTVCRHDDLEYTPGTIMADFVSTTTPSVIMKPIDGEYCTTVSRHACEMPYLCLRPFN